MAEGGFGPPSDDSHPWGFVRTVWQDDTSTALERLGRDSFLAWALRGWWKAHTSKESA